MSDGALTEANLSVESNTFRSFSCLHFLGVKENSNLLLEGFFSLQHKTLHELETVASAMNSPEYQSSYVVKYKSRLLQQINNNTTFYSSDKLLNATF